MAYLLYAVVIFVICPASLAPVRRAVVPSMVTGRETCRDPYRDGINAICLSN